MSENITQVGAGQTYPNLSAWITAVKAGSSTVAAGHSEIAECHGVITDNPDIDGFTYTDNDSKFVIRPAAGEKHTGIAGTGATLKNAGADGNLIFENANAGNLDIEDMILDNDGKTENNLDVRGNGSALKLINVDRCIFTSTGGAAWYQINAGNLGGACVVTINNCVLDGHSDGIVGYGTNVFANYVTMSRHAAGGFFKVKTTNCFVTPTGTGADYASALAGSEYNISADTSAPGLSRLLSKASPGDYFTDYLNGDFSLKGTTDNGGIFGATGLGGNDIGIAVDLIGNTRTAFDIGAFEFASAPPAGGGRVDLGIALRIGVGI